MKSKIVTKHVAISLCAIFISVVQAQVIFSDNFNMGASPLWGNQAGNWIANNGVYYANSPGNLIFNGLALNFTNFAVDVDVGGVGDGGIWLRSDSQGKNGVLLVTGGNGWGSGRKTAPAGRSIYWHVVTDGSAGREWSLVTNAFTGPGTQNVHIQVRVHGNLYSAFLNGATNPITSLTNSTFASGEVGLYDYSAQTFDNLVVQEYTNFVQVFPTLSITNSGPRAITLSWQTNATGYSLKSAASLPPPEWIIVTNVPVISGGTFSLTLKTRNTQQYFLLAP